MIAPPHAVPTPCGVPLQVVTEFRNMIASLQPSLARSAVEGEQALGAIAIDVGSGEMKMVAFAQRHTAEFIELAIVKTKELAGDTAGVARRVAAGDGALFEQVRDTLLAGLSKLAAAPPADAHPSDPRRWYCENTVRFGSFFLGATAWYRPPPRARPPLSAPTLRPPCRNDASVG